MDAALPLAGRPAARRCRRPRRRRSREREGAVMLVVMLVLLVATAAASVSVTTIQSELTAVGHDRVATQARYVAETATVMTIAYFDRIFQTPAWERFWQSWPEGTPPNMAVFGWPPVTSGRALRTTGLDHDEHERPGFESLEGPPVNAPNADDPLGSFGPRQAYGPMFDDDGDEVLYVVDLTDCHIAPSTSAGSPVGGPVREFYCVLTARARLELDGAGTMTRAWSYSGQAYTQNAFTSAHEARAVIITPPVPVGY